MRTGTARHRAPAEEFEHRFFERSVAVGWAEREDVARFLAEHGIDAVHQLIDGEKFLGRTRHNEGEGVLGSGCSQAAQDFVAAFVGEKEFPANAVVAV